MVELNATMLIVTLTENALNIPVNNKFCNKKGQFVKKIQQS